jgi:hypothetical protein
MRMRRPRPFSLDRKTSRFLPLLGLLLALLTLLPRCLLVVQPGYEAVIFNRLTGTELEFVIMVIAVSCVKLLSAHNSTQHTSRKHKV